jgi:hypothetical protein
MSKFCERILLVFYRNGGWEESVKCCTRNEERKESRTASLKVSVLKLK